MTTIINETAVVITPVSVSAAATKDDAVGVTEANAVRLIETLVSDKANWEQTAFKTSNDMLYSLLQRCYGYYVTMSQDDIDGKAARDGLKAYIKKHSISFKDSTHNITKIVKCVFGADRRRVSAYSIALRSAYAANTKPLEVVDFIIKNGGVEEIRLAKSKTALTQQQKIAHAKSSISDKVLFKVKSPELTQGLDTSKVGEKVVLIATQGADGELSINALISSEAASKAALAAYYSKVRKELIEAKKTDEAKHPQQAATEAVNAAVDKLAA